MNDDGTVIVGRSTDYSEVTFATYAVRWVNGVVEKLDGGEWCVSSGRIQRWVGCRRLGFE